MRPTWLVALLLAGLLAGCADPAPEVADPEPATPTPTASPAATRAANFDRFGLADDPSSGDPDASVVVAIFDAPKCASCALFHLHMLPDLEAKYADPGDVVFYFVQSTIGYAFDYDGGRAMECAYQVPEVDGDMSYRLFADRVFERQSEFNEETVQSMLREHGDSHGFDSDELERCYEEGLSAAAVDADFEVREATGSTGQTPVFQVFGASGPAKQANTRTLEDTIRAALE